MRRHWDPLQVADVPEAKDEYQRYLTGVYRLLERGASAREIANHLVQLETDELGFKDTDPKMLIPLARKLLTLKERFNIGSRGAG